MMWFSIWLSEFNSNSNTFAVGSQESFSNPFQPLFPPLKNENDGSTYLMTFVRNKLDIPPEAFKTYIQSNAQKLFSTININTRA